MAPWRILLATAVVSTAMAAAPGPASAAAGSCDPASVSTPYCTVLRLSSNALDGRDNGTPGSALARAYLVQKLKLFAHGLNGSASGDAAYLQTIPGGTNIVGVIPGTDLADQYVVVGAHYDHLGHSCQYKLPGDVICNGATDNAAGVAAALAIAQAIATQPTPPRRSIVIALWDREEDGLLGSQYFVSSQPLVPLAKIAGYVNFDIQGSNLLPSLRKTTFAVASESGGARLTDIVRTAIKQGPLDAEMLSSIFGEGRSDYANFLSHQVPSVFFTDATGPCYHTAQDQLGIVDFGKLQAQIGNALRVTRGLAGTGQPPVFTPGTPLATYADAQVISRLLERAMADLGRYSPSDQQTILRISAELKQIVKDGPAAFGSNDVGTLLGDSLTLVTQILPQGPCSGFLGP